MKHAVPEFNVCNIVNEQAALESKTPLRSADQWLDDSTPRVTAVHVYALPQTATVVML